jgi:hypothetical protein
MKKEKRRNWSVGVFRPNSYAKKFVTQKSLISLAFLRILERPKTTVVLSKSREFSRSRYYYRMKSQKKHRHSGLVANFG